MKKICGVMTAEGAIGCSMDTRLMEPQTTEQRNRPVSLSGALTIQPVAPAVFGQGRPYSGEQPGTNKKQEREPAAANRLPKGRPSQPPIAPSGAATYRRGTTFFAGQPFSFPGGCLAFLN